MRAADTGRQQGASLIDLMVGLAVGLAATLVTLNVAISFEARRRSLTGIADAQGNAGYAITMLSRELRMAGHGLGPPEALDCQLHRAATGAADAVIALRPVRVTQGTNGASDTLVTLAGGIRSAPAARLIAPYLLDSGLLQLDSTVGMAAGDQLMLQSDGKPECALLAIAGFGAGSSYAVLPAAAPDILPGTTFGTGSAAVNLGALRHRRYTVDNRQRLQLAAFNTGSGLWSGSTLADGVASLQLQYGFDVRPGTPAMPQVGFWSDDLIDADGNGSIDAADWRRLLALRIAIVTRSAQRKDGPCDAAVPAWLAGNPNSGALEPTPIRVDHLPDWRCWRYRVLQAEVPLRNQIWSDD